MNLAGHGCLGKVNKILSCHTSLICILLLIFNQPLANSSVVEKSSYPINPIRDQVSSSSEKYQEPITVDSAPEKSDDHVESNNDDDDESSTSFPHDHPLDAIHYAAVVSAAVRSGLREAKELYEKIEPDLYQKDLVIRGDHPSVYLAAINNQTPRAKELARIAYATLKATSVLKEQLAQFRDEREPPLTDVSLRQTPLQFNSNCPSKRQIDELCLPWTAQGYKYRSVDGTCNNLNNPQWGSAFQPFARFLPPEYEDGVSTIRKSVIAGNDLPSARRISTGVHKDVSRPSSTFTLMLMQWGQFLDHDLTATSQTRSFNHSIPKCCRIPLHLSHPDCLPIGVPADDEYFNGSISCMEFIRSSPVPRSDCTLGPREQLNQLTSWLDGSVIYGSTDEDLKNLRLFKKGKLQYSFMPSRKSLLPRLHHFHEGECVVTSPRLFCFHAGDARVNEQPGLAAMHTVWLRQHNLIAEKLNTMNPQWSEEVVFQETRKIVIAMVQHISYREFLPLLLGPNVMKAFGLRLLKTGYFTGYDDTADATVPNSFASAAFRFGHSLVQPTINRCDEAHREMPYKVDLSQEMMIPSNLHNLGEVDRISLGLASQRAQRRDEFITSQLTNHLFKTQGHKGLDLAAINIQRGRDHGLPPYLKWREACGLMKPILNNKSLETWNEFGEATGILPEKVRMLASVYESPWDVDLFPGGMVELPVKGGLVGPTFACIIGQTFRNLRRGDRFWYENPGQFTVTQLRAIRNTTLARVICDTSDAIQTVQPIIFLAPHLQKNPHASCTDHKSIPAVSLSPWAQGYLDNGGNSQNRVSDAPEEPSFYSIAEVIDPSEGLSTDEYASIALEHLDKSHIFTK